MKHLTSGVEILRPDPIGTQNDNGTRFSINNRDGLRVTVGHILEPADDSPVGVQVTRLSLNDQWFQLFHINS